MRNKLAAWALRLTGAGLLAASAAIHLDLYLTGYRTIPTIGWLFLLQVIAAFALSLAILVVPLIPLARPSGTVAEAAVAAAGAGFAIATLGGYLLSLWAGLFGFREIRTTAGVVAGILEIGAFAALASLAALTAGELLPSRHVAPVTSSGTARADAAAAPSGAAPAGAAPSGAGAGGTGRLRRAAVPGVAVASVAALAVLGASAATASGGQTAQAAGGSTVLRTTMIGGVSVLTNASGRTLYWFAPDTPGHSACYGTCAAYWPPVTGSPAAGAGVTLSKLGTIRRSDGSLQVTYAGHPLYTYIGDTAPGQASGNNINLNGGRWHDVPTAG